MTFSRAHCLFPSDAQQQHQPSMTRLWETTAKPQALGGWGEFSKRTSTMQPAFKSARCGLWTQLGWYRPHSARAVLWVRSQQHINWLRGPHPRRPALGMWRWKDRAVQDHPHRVQKGMPAPNTNQTDLTCVILAPAETQ